MKKSIHLTAIMLLLMSFSLQAQKAEDSNKISINDQFVISLQEKSIDQVSDYYEIDFSEFNFASEKDMKQFCEFSSGGFHTFKANFDAKIIEVHFNTEMLGKSNMTIASLNQYLVDVSRKLKSTYNAIKSE
ncbi:hypothetical protein EZY14_001075 [Kordia sp. TARA_039_SRF]|nr:hypothetical protein EZY14_001075 [Kordia sp. TARA_039_SRF]